MAGVNPEQTLQALKGLFVPVPEVLDPFRDGKVYNKHATLDLKDAAAYASIEIKVDLPIERLGRVSFERGGTEFIGWPAEMFHVRDKFIGLPVQNKGVNGATETRLVIPFADESLRTLQGIRRGELVILSGEKVQIKVAVNGKESGDPEIPEFTATARVLPEQAARVFSQRYTETTIKHNKSGEMKHDFPLMGMNERLRKMFLSCEDDDITKVEIKRDNKTIYEVDVEDLAYNQRRFADRRPTDKFVVLDWTETGFAAESAFIPVAGQSLKLVVTKRSVGVITIHNDYLEQETDLL